MKIMWLGSFMGISSLAGVVGTEPKTWLESWWDFSSFGPDLVIGIGTGLIVALIVLGAERRLSTRARNLEVTNAQGAAVEKGRSVLQHRIKWPPEDSYDLTPDRTQLDRLVPSITAVPSGDPFEHLPGFHFAQRVVEVLDEVEGAADALDSQIDRHEWNGNVLAVPDAIMHNVHRLLAGPSPSPHDWSWDWSAPPSSTTIPHAIVTQIENDLELRQLVLDYLRNRRLLEAHRAAFLLADGLWRADEWAALTARHQGVPHNFVKTRFRRWKYYRAVAAAKNNAETRANDLIVAVDPMAH
ncbi:hypothetical protein [Microbacterium sp. K24]|uniref:hypothetical protein n=1 Tax=Microbacterium sp. K24 TaxID=2305446 RepID=UPI00109D7544|nr:hypothetical protein [Microbacterium sp. K24]